MTYSSTTMLPASSPRGLSTQSSSGTSLPSSIASATVASASSTPTVCGEHGNFTLTFDDLPSFTPSNGNRTDVTDYPPVTASHPYHHLTFDSGYVYAPRPVEPYTAHSQPNVAVFLTNSTGMSAGTHPGEIGDADYDSLSAFWFDAISAWFGCDNKGPECCTLVMSAYTWSDAAKTEIVAATQNATIEPCDGSDCQLERITFPTSFRGLSGLQIQAYVDNERKMFMMDDLALGWSNNTCAAGMTRLRYQ
jgi:hypothetical protein